MSSFNAFPVGWHVKEIKDANITIIDGDRGVNYPSKDEFVSNGYCLFLNTGNLKNDCFDFSTCDFITENKDALLRKGKLRRKDIVLTTRGTVGSVGFFHNNISYEHIRINSGMVVLRCAEGVSPDYSYHLFKSSLLKTQYSLYSSGAAQPQLPIKDLKRINLPIPPLDVQEKIAAILSAYDELIENNQRRIALLEKMAEEIYREWFVRLRFPGHEKVKKVKGVPEDWRIAELKELAVVNPSSISLRDKPVVMLYVDISSVSTNQIEKTTSYAYSQAPSRARRRVKHGDVIWSSVRPANRAYCLIYESPDNLIVSTGFAVIRPKTAIPFSFLFFAVTSNSFVDQMTTVAKGSAYPATSFDDFEKAKLLVPSDDLLKSFHEKVEPLFRQKNLFQQQCERLKHIRNLLLPRLISGKLSVENLDIRFPPSMEEMSDEV
ncbi:MAG: restriction endonuclease subunit S [Nitrosomonas sp.]|nr:restriction endonuclease subunit S [Nitrosomonas sp.]